MLRWRVRLDPPGSHAVTATAAAARSPAPPARHHCGSGGRGGGPPVARGARPPATPAPPTARRRAARRCRWRCAPWPAAVCSGCPAGAPSWLARRLCKVAPWRSGPHPGWGGGWAGGRPPWPLLGGRWGASLGGGGPQRSWCISTNWHQPPPSLPPSRFRLWRGRPVLCGTRMCVGWPRCQGGATAATVGRRALTGFTCDKKPLLRCCAPSTRSPPLAMYCAYSTAGVAICPTGMYGTTPLCSPPGNRKPQQAALWGGWGGGRAQLPAPLFSAAQRPMGHVRVAVGTTPLPFRRRLHTLTQTRGAPPVQQKTA